MPIESVRMRGLIHPHLVASFVVSAAAAYPVTVIGVEGGLLVACREHLVADGAYNSAERAFDIARSRY